MAARQPQHQMQRADRGTQRVRVPAQGRPRVPRRYHSPSEQDLRFALLTSPHEVRGLLAMYCGLRPGGSCAVTRDSITGNHLRIDRQVQALRETGKPTVVRLAPTKS